MTIAAVGEDVKRYKAGDKVLVNFANPTQIIVNDPVLTETVLETPSGTVAQMLQAPMRQVKRPVEYYFMWEHDIFGKVLEDGK